MLNLTAVRSALHARYSMAETKVSSCHYVLALNSIEIWAVDVQNSCRWWMRSKLQAMSYALHPSLRRQQLPLAQIHEQT